VGADYDDPRILQNIIHETVDPTRGPSHVQESMVYRMGQEVKFVLLRTLLLPPFRNIRCFSFVKLMYLDIF
jgi:hypothetical protein